MTILKNRLTTRVTASLIALAAVTGFALLGTSPAPAASAAERKPTIVLVHGAFADASGWNTIIKRLQQRGYPTVAVANPLRSVKEDAASLDAHIASIDGPVVLVGHSYGGAVMTNVKATNTTVKSLVYIAAFAPAEGEAAGDLANKYPGSTLGATLTLVPLPDGTNDLNIKQSLFRNQFAADVSAPEAALMAATQRPIRDAALSEASGAPAWARIPSWFLLAEADKNIPLRAQQFMADRANSRETTTIEGASHVVHVSHPNQTTALIIRAAHH
jgi:pimeloyl-ACP methyl ester carboxylesterase